MDSKVKIWKLIVKFTVDKTAEPLSRLFINRKISKSISHGVGFCQKYPMMPSESWKFEEEKICISLAPGTKLRGENEP